MALPVSEAPTTRSTIRGGLQLTGRITVVPVLIIQTEACCNRRIGANWTLYVYC